MKYIDRISLPSLILYFILNLYHSLKKFSSRQIDDMFLFPQKTGLGVSCKLSPLETICMKCQNLFSEKNKKNISICRLLKKKIPRVQGVKAFSVIREDCKIIMKTCLCNFDLLKLHFYIEKIGLQGYTLFFLFLL